MGCGVFMSHQHGMLLRHEPPEGRRVYVTPAWDATEAWAARRKACLCHTSMGCYWGMSRQKEGVFMSHQHGMLPRHGPPEGRRVYVTPAWDATEAWAARRKACLCHTSMGCYWGTSRQKEGVFMSHQHRMLLRHEPPEGRRVYVTPAWDATEAWAARRKACLCHTSMGCYRGMGRQKEGVFMSHQHAVLQDFYS